MEKHLSHIKQNTTCENIWREQVGISVHVYLSWQRGRNIVFIIIYSLL